MGDNVIQGKSYHFSVAAITFSRHMPHSREGNLIAHQFLRSAMSIGANVEEAIGGISRRDFISKMSIAQKESRESHYWLRLIRDTSIFQGEELHTLIRLSEELVRILTSIVKTSQGH